MVRPSPEFGDYFEQAGKALLAAKRVAIVSHVRPDGDAVGSVVGMGHALREAGKAPEMLLADGVPARFRFLPGADKVRKRLNGDVDLVVALDCSDQDRLGNALPAGRLPDINIDHHITNLRYAPLNLVDTEAVSTTAMLADYLPGWGFALSEQAASGLLMGLVTDTIGFRTANVNPRAMQIAADLMEAGADLPDLYRRALVEFKYEAARIWGAGLARMQRLDGLIWTSLTQSDREAAGYPGRDDADLVNVLSSIEKSDIQVIFVEQPTGEIKVSWRARPGFDVAEVALQFGGGGHPAASGATIVGTLQEVENRVLVATRALLKLDEPQTA